MPQEMKIEDEEENDQLFSWIDKDGGSPRFWRELRGPQGMGVVSNKWFSRK